MAAAASEGCLRVRSIHVIDESRYFVDRFGGGCRDAGVVVLLESCAPPVEACWSRIDIAGGSYGCADAADLDLFRTILRNADLPDLGLGPDHVVRRLLP